MAAQLTIPSRFNGPVESGNGGYCCAAVARFADGPVAVSLRRPVPLDRPLEVVPDGDGGGVRALDGGETVVEAVPVPELDLEPPGAVTVAEARAAAAAYRGPSDGPFAHCFVCGRAREDALGVFAGPVEGRDMVASPWTPPAWSAGAADRVPAEIVGAVLDCPTYFAAYRHDPDPLPAAVLARFQVRVGAPIEPGVEHVVTGWPLAVDGRKREAGSAVLAADGTVLAVARALMVEPRAA